MRFKAVGPDSWFGIDRKNGIAYAPQESWLLNETIKACGLLSSASFAHLNSQENIVMGTHFDEDRYEKGALPLIHMH